MSDKLVYSVAEAAEICGVSPNTMYECVRQNIVRSVRLGRRILIPRSSLADLLSMPHAFGATGDIDE